MLPVNCGPTSADSPKPLCPIIQWTMPRSGSSSNSLNWERWRYRTMLKNLQLRAQDDTRMADAELCGSNLAVRSLLLRIHAAVAPLQSLTRPMQGRSHDSTGVYGQIVVTSTQRPGAFLLFVPLGNIRKASICAHLRCCLCFATISTIIPQNG